MTIPTPNERIGYRSTEGSGTFRKDRWQVLEVYYCPDERQPFVAVETGKSRRVGEGDRVRKLNTNSLERTLAFFEDTQPARVVRDQAREWLKDNAARVAAHNAGPSRNATTAEVLDYLYGPEAVAKRGFLARVSRDLNVPESSIRAALTRDMPLKVPLAAVAALINKAALPSHVEAANG